MATRHAAPPPYLGGYRAGEMTQTREGAEFAEGMGEYEPGEISGWLRLRAVG